VLPVSLFFSAQGAEKRTDVMGFHALRRVWHTQRGQARERACP
jgi:hypothetical protein